MIWDRERKGVIEDGARLRESDAVLPPVRRFLSSIPLKSDSIHLPSSLANWEPLRELAVQEGFRALDVFNNAIMRGGAREAPELSSFQCGHDALIYAVVEEIVEHSGTPYFRFKDIDENKPSGSIRIRVETIGYFLKRYREDMVRNKRKTGAIEDQLREKLDSMAGAFEAGSMPRIHVSVAALAASRPPEPEYETVSGD